MHITQPTLSRIAAIATACLALVSVPAQKASESKEIKFKKIVLDTRFLAEGVAVADVNRDGKLDVMAGNMWYEAPNWTPHVIAPYQAVDPATAYSNCFNSWAVDLNHDGWPDQIVIGYPGEKAVWRENPKGRDIPWPEHPIWHSACDESPLYADLFGNGKNVLIMGYDDAYLAWFEPAADPNAEWVCHNVSELKGSGSQRYTHGLGVGDVDGDRKNEILTHTGYYVGSKTGPRHFVKADLGPDCAQMRVYDVNQDRRPDVITSAAHERGVWWFEQKKDGSGFEQHLIDQTLSQTHSLVLADINKDGAMDIVTGKRVWAHGPNGDPGPNEPAWLVWYELKRSKSGVEWTRHIIDDDSGIGTEFEVIDINKDGLPDVVVANKKGVFVFEQIRR